MKKIIIAVSIGSVLFITSCKTELEKLTAEKASLETKLLEAKKGLKEVNEKISEMDSTKEEVFAGVTVFNVKKEVFEHSFEIQGAVVSEKNVIVVPEVGGLLKDLNVAEGDFIKKGAIIATFDSKIIASNKKELEEQISLAQYMFDKQTSLFDQGVGTELAVKQAEGQLRTLEKTLASLNTQQGKFKVLAPFSGFVEELFTVKGQVAGPGSPIIRLVNLDNLSVKADISESYLSKLNSSKNRADVSFPALGNIELNNLPIKRIGNFVNPVNRTIVVEVDLPKSEEKFIPNLMAVLKIKDYTNPGAIVIPSRIILRDINQDPYIFVLENDTVKERKIELGQSSGDFTEVYNGVSEGEVVVDRGSRGVKNNQKVAVRD